MTSPFLPNSSSPLALPGGSWNASDELTRTPNDTTSCVIPGDASWGNVSSLCENVTLTLLNGTSGGSGGGAYPLVLTMFLGLLAAAVCLVTILGNVTVLLAFGLERSIRQPTNYFIASLAVSDLLIGTFSMPLFTQYLLLNYWPLGPWLCDLWLSLDWTVCLTSQYTVFFITMDRFLSVKIPAKYRSWRTERKVRVMVGITWVVPSLIFFTTIIGWQYFVGERTVKPLTCEVQFMSDPLFTFLLTIGYYWITLVVMCILYGGIYKVALDLQRKSDAKQRKLQSTMELATGDHNNSGGGGGKTAISAAATTTTTTTVSNGSDSERPRRGYFQKQRRRWKGGAGKEREMGGSSSSGSRTCRSPAHPHLPPRSPLPHLHTPTSLTSRQTLGTPSSEVGGTGTRHNSLDAGSVLTDGGDHRDEDRSSSPAFASDEEGSSSGATPGGGKSPNVPGFPSSNGRRSMKSSLNPKAGIAGIVNTAMLTTPGSFQRGLLDSHVLPGILLDNPASFPHLCVPGVREEAGTPMLPSGERVKSGHGGPDYSKLDTQPESCAEKEADLDAENDADTSREHPEPSGGGVRQEDEEEDVSKYCPYIDEDSFMAVTSGREGDLVPVCSPDEGKLKLTDAGQQGSPLWKRRNSLPLPPLASEAFDIIIDDDFTDLGVTEITMTTTLTSSKLNGGEDVPPAEDTDHPTDGEGSAAPLNPTRHKLLGGAVHRKFMDSRRSRKSDGRLHSFVKSVRSRNSRRRNRRERKSKSENRARKALRTITIILGAFVLCWTPYHIMVFVIAMCEGYGCINLGFYNFTYWLCYLNSPINPFCYAFANAQFKRTFLRILRFDWHRT